MLCQLLALMQPDSEGSKPECHTGMTRTKTVSFEVCWSKTNHGKVTCVVAAYELTGTEGRGYQEAHFLGARTDKR